MSRHQLPAKSLRYEVVVGWDPPLQTYFAQVYDTEGKQDEQPFIWLGADGIAVTWKTIALTISPYASTTPEILAALIEDKKLNRG